MSQTRLDSIKPYPRINGQVVLRPRSTIAMTKCAQFFSPSFGSLRKSRFSWFAHNRRNNERSKAERLGTLLIFQVLRYIVGIFSEDKNPFHVSSRKKVSFHDLITWHTELKTTKRTSFWKKWKVKRWQRSDDTVHTRGTCGGRHYDASWM